MTSISFENFLRLRLQKEEFDNLPAILGCSAHRRTKILEDQRIMNNSEVLRLACKLDIQPIDLVEGQETGADVLTPVELEMMKMLKGSGLSAAKIAA